MSHSRIFKIQYDLTEEFEQIKEYDFYDNGFIDGYHDGVDGDTDEFDDYQWLTTSMGEIFQNLRKDSDGHYLVDVEKESCRKWLYDRFERMEAHIAKAESELTTPDARLSMSWYSLRELIDGDREGFYFYMDNCYYTDMEIVRELYEFCFGKGETKITLRLEGTLDYHC